MERSHPPAVGRSAEPGRVFPLSTVKESRPPSQDAPFDRLKQAREKAEKLLEAIL